MMIVLLTLDHVIVLVRLVQAVVLVLQKLAGRLVVEGAGAQESRAAARARRVGVVLPTSSALSPCRHIYESWYKHTVDRTIAAMPSEAYKQTANNLAPIYDTCGRKPYNKQSALFENKFYAKL